MDAWREGDTFTVEFDLPGIDVDSIDLDVERNVLTVRADRPAREGIAELVAAERPRGVFSRQLILGDNLDTEHISASYDGGVLRLEIPVAEKAKPRKIAVQAADDSRVVEGEGHKVLQLADPSAGHGPWGGRLRARTAPAPPVVGARGSERAPRLPGCSGSSSSSSSRWARWRCWSPTSSGSPTRRPTCWARSRPCWRRTPALADRSGESAGPIGPPSPRRGRRPRSRPHPHRTATYDDVRRPTAGPSRRDAAPHRRRGTMNPLAFGGLGAARAPDHPGCRAAAVRRLPARRSRARAPAARSRSSRRRPRVSRARPEGRPASSRHHRHPRRPAAAVRARRDGAGPAAPYARPEPVRRGPRLRRTARRTTTSAATSDRSARTVSLTIKGRPVKLSLAWLKPPAAPADGSMTLFEHLRELRYRLVVAALAIVVGTDRRLVLPRAAHRRPAAPVQPGGRRPQGEGPRGRDAAGRQPRHRLAVHPGHQGLGAGRA